MPLPLDPFLDLPFPPVPDGGEHLATMQAPPAPVTDPERLARIRTAIRMLAQMAPTEKILHALCRDFEIPREQAYRDLGDVRMEMRRLLDDEGVIDATMFSAIVQHRASASHFLELAFTPIPTSVRAYTDDGEPFDRDLTPGEYAKLVTAKATAMKVAQDAMIQVTELVGRRSPRWAKIPAVIQSAVTVQIDADLSPEERTALARFRGDG